MRTRELLDIARREVAELTGNRVETISAFHRNGGKELKVSVEVLELRRVPDTMDLLASYEVTLSDDGDVLGLERRRRYHRAAVDGD